MDENQKQLNYYITNIFKSMGYFEKPTQEFTNRNAEIDAMRIFEEDKVPLRQNAIDTLKSTAAETCKGILTNLSGIRITLEIMDTQISFSDNFNSAVALINATGKELPVPVRLNLIEKFLGYKFQLSSLKSVFVAKGVDCRSIDEFLFNSEAECDEVEQIITRITYKPQSASTDLLSLGNRLTQLAKRTGVKLEKSYREYFDYSSNMVAAITSAAGI